MQSALPVHRKGLDRRWCTRNGLRRALDFPLHAWRVAHKVLVVVIGWRFVDLGARLLRTRIRQGLGAVGIGVAMVRARRGELLRLIRLNIVHHFGCVRGIEVYMSE